MYWSRKLLVLVACLTAAQSAIADVADDDFHVATRQFSRGRWASAETELAAFLKSHPNDRRVPDAHFLLGESLVQQRRYREARPHFAQYVRHTGADRYLRQAEFRGAEAAFHAGEHAMARSELEAFRGRYPDDALHGFALAYLGEIALAAGEAEVAASLFGEVLQGEPVERLKAQGSFGLAQAHEQLDHVEDAIGWYGRVTETTSRYARQARLRIALLHYRRAEFDLAAPLLEQLVANATDDLLFEARYWLGMSQLGQQNWSAAATTLQAGFENGATHRLATARNFALAEALRHAGRAEEAKEHYAQLVALDPPTEWSDDAGQILVQLAWEADDLAAVDELAGRFFERHASSPLADRVGQLKGRALLSQQDYAAAVKVFERLLETPPASDASQQSASLRTGNQYYLAIAYLGAERPADVLRALPAVAADGPGAADLNDGLKVARASALMALGRYEQAIGPLQAFVATHPTGVDSVDCHAKLIVALGHTGQWYAATESFELFRQRHPESGAVVTTATFVAELALARGAPDVAAPLFTFLAGDASDVVETESRQRVLMGLAGLARSQFDRGLLDEANQTTKRLMALAPPPDVAATVLLSQARALEADGQPDAALESYQQVFQRDPMCAQASTALFAAARILSSHGQREAASQRLEQLLRQHAAYDHRDVALYQLAWLLLETGQGERADDRFEELVVRHPASPLWADAAFRLARNAADRRDTAGAQRWLDELLHGVARRASRAQPRTTDRRADSASTATDVGQILCHAHYLQGKLAVDAGQWLAALRSYQRIVEQHPESDLASAAMFWCAESQFHLQQYEQADAMLARLSEVLGASTGSREEYQAMIPLRRAQMAAQRRQWQDALDLAQSIEPRFPDFSLQFEADYVIGRCLTTQARFSMARQSFRSVTTSSRAQRTETAAMAQWMIGETYFHQSKYEEAIRAYYRVDALYDQPQWQAAALLQAAKCHELSGQWSQAHQLYSQLRSDYPQTTYAAEATRRIRVATRPRADQ